MKLVILSVLVLATLTTATPPLIAFVANQNGFPEIAVVPSDGSSPPRILTDMRTTHVEHPRLSHSRQTIVFSSDFEAKFPILYSIGVDGDNKPIPLTSTVLGAQIAADWSPDDSLLIMEEVDENTQFTRLVLIDAEGNSRFPVVEEPQQHNDFFARWAPHGDEILFLSDRDAYHPEFMLLNLHEVGSLEAISSLRHLPPIVHYPMGNGPSFSPSGEEFIYEEEAEAHFVSLIQSTLNEDVKHLFSVDVIQKPKELSDLSLSQCVYSPLDNDSLCCRYLRTDESNAVLAIVTKEGMIVKTLTSESMYASTPSWK